MDTFYDVIQQYDWAATTRQIHAATPADVERALGRERVTMDDIAALVSPAAAPYLKAMAEKSYRTTRRRFGHTMQLYVPLYLSNYCTNHCVYCGFNCRNQIRRAILDEAAIRREAEALTAATPFRHILLVTGEAPAKSSVAYIGRAIEIMRDYFEQVSIEVQPLTVDEYKYLMDKGLHSVYVYQETYNEARYPLYHPRGRKADYRYRLETADRLGQAGIYKTGLGNLIGLEEWRTEAWFTALHLRYLERAYWRTKGSIAFPRLRPYAGEGAFVPEHPASERDLLQLICAYRLASEDVELSISTRESAAVRDRIMPFGVTTMSAGSSTAPGGYADPEDRELEQFAIDDARTPEAVAAAIRAHGLEPVWKDWSPGLQEACIG